MVSTQKAESIFLPTYVTDIIGYLLKVSKSFDYLMFHCCNDTYYDYIILYGKIKVNNLQVK